jgi:hypothetical protein
MLKAKFFISLLLTFPLLSASPLDFALEQNYPENIVVNNRVLLKVNGKTITVMDVVRKMDLLFYRQYPELASSVVARYQFYASGWRSILGAVIDDSLILADAEEKGVTINDGEVREELEKLFGPDVVLNLDQLGMTLSEAFDLLKTELTVQRMTSMMVRSKAMTEISPQSVKKRYDNMLLKNPPQNFWVYQILSIRGDQHEQVANEVYHLIQEQNISFESLASHFEHEGVELAYSEEFRQSARELSLAYRSVLETLSVGSVSAPVSSRNGSRIFCLKRVERDEPRNFREIEDELKQELMREAMAKYNAEYRQKLRGHFDITENYLTQAVPQTLQPFALK